MKWDTGVSPDIGRFGRNVSQVGKTDPNFNDSVDPGAPAVPLDVYPQGMAWLLGSAPKQTPGYYMTDYAAIGRAHSTRPSRKGAVYNADKPFVPYRNSKQGMTQYYPTPLSKR